MNGGPAESMLAEAGNMRNKFGRFLPRILKIWQFIALEIVMGPKWLMMTTVMTEHLCSLVEASRLIDLRHQVLRQGLPRESAIFEGDDQAKHFAVLDDNRVVCCLSMLNNPLPDTEADPAIWQLRGMATAEDFREQGLGKQLMIFMEETLQPKLIWCNARCVAIPFYQKCGWSIISEEFSIAHAGPHVRMSKQVRVL